MYTLYTQNAHMLSKKMYTSGENKLNEHVRKKEETRAKHNFVLSISQHSFSVFLRTKKEEKNILLNYIVFFVGGQHSRNDNITRCMQAREMHNGAKVQEGVITQTHIIIITAL